MAYGSKMDSPAAEGQSPPAPAMNAQSGSDQARIQALMAEPLVPLNVQLHDRILRSGSAKASTLKSAMASLERMRKTRAAP